MDKRCWYEEEIETDKEQQQLKYQGMVLGNGNDSVHAVVKASDGCSLVGEGCRDERANAPLYRWRGD